MKKLEVVERGTTTGNPTLCHFNSDASQNDKVVAINRFSAAC